MKLMVMHKVDAKMEAGERPSDTLIHDMGRLIGSAIKEGIFKDGAGLHRSAARARVKLDGQSAVVERGPYAGSNELLASFAMITAKSIDHAAELATELARAGGDPEIEVGPVVEGWDIHGGTRPANAPYRFLLLRKASREFEAGAPAPAAVRKVLDGWKRDGLLISAATLAPSSKGARLRTAGGTRKWSDGPFAEAKELVAGYSILELPSIDAAKLWTEKYAAILGDIEVDIRVVVD